MAGPTEVGPTASERERPFWNPYQGRARGSSVPRDRSRSSRVEAVCLRSTRGDQTSVRTDGERPDLTLMSPDGHELGVTLPLQVVPFPAPPFRRALVEQL